MNKQTKCGINYVETETHYIVSAANKTFKGQKRVINNSLELSKYMSSKFFNKKIKLSNELTNYRKRFQLPVDGKISQGARLCGFISPEGKWVLQTPTLDDMLRMYYETRAYLSDKKPKDTIKTNTIINEDDFRSFNTHHLGDRDQQLMKKICDTLQASFIPEELKEDICKHHLNEALRTLRTLRV